MTRSREVAQAIKSRLLPHGSVTRRIPLGLGAGVRLPIDLAQHSRLYLGLYELELHRHIRALCLPGLRSFDVGAQIGYDSLVLARLSRAPVMSFEADPRLIPALRETFAANPSLSQHLHLREGRVAAQSSATRGLIALDDAAYSDGFVPGFIKVDIDGGEAEALAGAIRLLRDARPHLIIETHSLPLELECAERLREAGYRPRVVHQRRVLPDHRPMQHNRWLVATGAPHPSTFASSSYARA